VYYFSDLAKLELNILVLTLPLMNLFNRSYNLILMENETDGMGK